MLPPMIYIYLLRGLSDRGPISLSGVLLSDGLIVRARRDDLLLCVANQKAESETNLFHQ